MTTSFNFDDGNNDRRADLVCEVELKKLPYGVRETKLVLEAETDAGLKVVGVDTVGVADAKGVDAMAGSTR